MELNHRRDIHGKDYLVLIVLFSALGFPGSLASVWGEGIETVVSYGCFVLELFLMFLTGGRRLFAIRRHLFPIYLFLGIVSVMSMLVTTDPVGEFIGCTRLCVTALFAVWLSRQYSVEKLLKLLCAAQAAFIAVSVGFALLYPSVGFQDTSSVQGALRGLYDQKNSFSSELSCMIVVNICALKRHPRKPVKAVRHIRWCNRYTLLLAAQILLLVWCKSMGSILSTLLVAVYILFFSRLRFQPGTVFVLVSVGFLALSFTVLPALSPLFSLLGRDATLTGRTLLWWQSIKVALHNHPLTGVGYGMFWSDSDYYQLIQKAFAENSFFRTMTTGAHNFLVELWLNIGLIGIAALFYMSIRCLRGYRRLDRIGYLFVSSFMLLYTLHGMTERALINNSYSTLLLFSVLALGARENARREERLSAEDLRHGH